MNILKHFLVSVVLASAAFAYNYPIGIPTAWMEPDAPRPARPNPWTAEIPGYYYIDEATGTDTGRTYGSPAAPRRSIPVPLPAGSYTEVVGTYSQTVGGVVLIRGAGTSGPWVANTSGPAWIVGRDAANRPFFNRTLLFEGAYLCVEYLTGNQDWNVNHPDPAAMRTASNMLIRYCELDGQHTTNFTALSLNGTDFSTSQDIIVYNNTVHGYGPLAVDVDRDYIGIFNVRSERIWILDNHVYEMAGVGIGHSAKTGTPAQVRYIYVGRNHVHHCWAAGIAFKTCEHVVISQNHVHDTVDVPWSNGWGIGGQYAALDVWIMYNEIYNCDNGIRVASTNLDFESVYIFGNLIYNIQPSTTPYQPSAFGQAAIGLWGADHRYVVGNTIHNAIRGIAMPHATTNIHGSIIEFNIFSNIALDDFYIENPSATTRIRNNVFYRGGANARINLGGTTYTLATLPAVHAGNVGVNPMFVDPASRNYRVQAEIPLLTSSSMTQNIFADFGTVFSVANPPPPPLLIRTYSDLVDIAPTAPTQLSVSP